MIPTTLSSVNLLMRILEINESVILKISDNFKLVRLRQDRIIINKSESFEVLNPLKCK
jgi:hypothetical protein